MKKILLIIILFTSACGYNPIYLNKNLDNFKFLTVTLNGDKEINRKIVSALSIKEDKSNLNNENLILDSSFKIEETSKNSKGQVTSYRSTITVKFTIKENNEIKNNKEFRDSFAYGNRENKFDLVTYQNEVKNNITNKIIEEIIFYMNLE
tara:strand:- start:1747 stop:2196 length:450 start_codon:yes stop_codon:yes gene_type:complete